MTLPELKLLFEGYKELEYEYIFTLGNEYKIEELSPKLIEVSIIAETDKKYIKGWGFFNEFDFVSVDELGYENSIELLFNHYPFGKSNCSNAILVNKSGQVIAISYNSVGRNEIIYSDCPNLKGGIVVNKEYFIKGEYDKKDINLIIKRIGGQFAQQKI